VILEPLEFVILCLASYRITRFFVNDSLMGFGPNSGSRLSVRVDRFAYRGDDDPEVLAGEAAPGTGRSWWREYLGDLLTCTWCSGFWYSAAVYFAFLSGTVGLDGIEATDWTVHGVTVFAIAGVQGYLNTRMNA
jgi:hypothetical protein